MILLICNAISYLQSAAFRFPKRIGVADSNTAFTYEQLWDRVSRRVSYRSHKVFMTVFGCLRTNLLVIIGRYFSNAATLTMALLMLRHTVAAPGFTMLNLQLFANLGFSSQMLCTLVIALAAVLAVSIAKERQVDVTGWICNQKWYIQFAIVFLSLLTIVFCVYANTDYVPIAYVYENV